MTPIFEIHFANAAKACMTGDPALGWVEAADEDAAIEAARAGHWLVRRRSPRAGDALRALEMRVEKVCY